MVNFFIFSLVLIGFSGASMASEKDMMIDDNPFLTIEDIKAKLKANREDIINKALQENITGKNKSTDSVEEADFSASVSVLAVTKKKALVSINGATRTIRDGGRIFIGKDVFSVEIERGVVTLYDFDEQVFFQDGVSFSVLKEKK